MVDLCGLCKEKEVKCWINGNGYCRRCFIIYKHKLLSKVKLKKKLEMFDKRERIKKEREEYKILEENNRVKNPIGRPHK